MDKWIKIYSRHYVIFALHTRVDIVRKAADDDEDERRTGELPAKSSTYPSRNSSPIPDLNFLTFAYSEESVYV